MNIEEYVVGIIMAAVFLVCAVIKPFLKENTKWLPAIAGLLGIGFNAWYNKSFDFAIFVTGLASGLSATGLDQLYKQTTGYYDKQELGE